MPKFLRFSGKIRNREMKKGEVEALVKQVWKEHAEYEVRVGDQQRAATSRAARVGERRGVPAGCSFAGVR